MKNLKRYLVALRLLCHWSTGAVIGSILTVDHWTEWATVFLILHLSFQIFYVILDRRRK